jgi:hypothetical protein
MYEVQAGWSRPQFMAYQQHLCRMKSLYKVSIYSYILSETPLAPKVRG